MNKKIRIIAVILILTGGIIFIPNDQVDKLDQYETRDIAVVPESEPTSEDFELAEPEAIEPVEPVETPPEPKPATGPTPAPPEPVKPLAWREYLAQHSTESATNAKRCMSHYAGKDSHQLTQVKQWNSMGDEAKNKSVEQYFRAWLRWVAINRGEVQWCFDSFPQDKEVEVIVTPHNQQNDNVRKPAR